MELQTFQNSQSSVTFLVLMRFGDTLKATYIFSVSKHTETEELFVCYRALYGEFGYYVRPLDMFLSEVDREKYPNAEQIYRFERVAFD